MGPPAKFARGNYMNVTPQWFFDPILLVNIDGFVKVSISLIFMHFWWNINQQSIKISKGGGAWPRQGPPGPGAGLAGAGRWGQGPTFDTFIDFWLIFHQKCMKINEIETSTNPSISTNIGSENHWGVVLTSNDREANAPWESSVGSSLPVRQN